MDLFFINDLKKQKIKSGLVCIDVFTKYATVVPLQGKNGKNSAMGIIQSVKETGRKPTIVYTDGATGFDTYALREYFIKENIKHYMTRTHAHVAERFIRTYKALLRERKSAFNIFPTQSNTTISTDANPPSLQYQSKQPRSQHKDSGGEPGGLSQDKVRASTSVHVRARSFGFL
jgi:hypothetical protein